MSNNYIIQFKVSLENGEVYTESIREGLYEGFNLEISDKSLENILKRVSVGSIKFLAISLNCPEVFIEVKEYSLTDEITINKFINHKQMVSVIKSANVNLHINDLEIDFMQVECKKLLLADSTVKEIDINISNEFENNIEAESIDIRSCRIDKLNIYSQCDYLNIQQSVIRTLDIHNQHNSRIIKKFHAWQNTHISFLNIDGKIEELILEDCILEHLFAKYACFISNLNEKNTIISNCYNFTPDRFAMLDYNKWNLVYLSTFHSHDKELRAESGYQIQKLSTHHSKGVFSSLLAKVFDFCCGYGYKPIKTAITAAYIIIVCSLIYTIIDVFVLYPDFWDVLKQGVNLIARNVGRSMGAFIGRYDPNFSNIGYTIISGIQYIAGIILFAIFVNALYVRYKD